jgi:hypothetical protein
MSKGKRRAGGRFALPGTLQGLSTKDSALHGTTRSASAHLGRNVIADYERGARKQLRALQISKKTATEIHIKYRKAFQMPAEPWLHSGLYVDYGSSNERRGRVGMQLNQTFSPLSTYTLDLIGARATIENRQLSHESMNKLVREALAIESKVQIVEEAKTQAFEAVMALTKETLDAADQRVAKVQHILLMAMNIFDSTLSNHDAKCDCQGCRRYPELLKQIEEL